MPRPRVAGDAGRGDRELAASARLDIRAGPQRVRRCSRTGTLGLGRHVIGQVVHMQHVAAGKDARHARLQTLVHHGAARARVKLNTRAYRKLVLGNQTYRKQQRVARNDALGPRNGRQIFVDLAHLDGLHAVVPNHACDGGGQVQRNAKIVQAILYIAAQAVGVWHKLVHALDRNPLERAATRHDEPNVARA